VLLIDFVWQPHQAEVPELVEEYADYGMDVADVCIVLLAQNNPRLTVPTTERKDFTVYRTLKGKAVRCQFPPD